MAWIRAPSNAMKACMPHKEFQFSTLRPRQYVRHFADCIFKCIFANVNYRILIQISLQFVYRGAISNMPALFYIRAWCRAGDKPLFKPMMA